MGETLRFVDFFPGLSEPFCDCAIAKLTSVEAITYTNTLQNFQVLEDRQQHEMVRHEAAEALGAIATSDARYLLILTNLQ